MTVSHTQHTHTLLPALQFFLIYSAKNSDHDYTSGLAWLPEVVEGDGEDSWLSEAVEEGLNDEEEEEKEQTLRASWTPPNLQTKLILCAYFNRKFAVMVCF